MAKKGKQSLWTQRLVTGASVAAVLMLWACAASVYLKPSAVKGLAVVGLGFPIFVGGVVLMLVLALLLAPRRAWIPVVGLAGCCGSLRSYCPVNIPRKAPERSLKVISYNVGSWDGSNYDGRMDKVQPIAGYLAEEGADVVCLQEAMATGEHFYRDSLLARMPYEMHCDTVAVGDLVLAVVARYPIVGKRMLTSKEHNQAAAFWLKMSDNDTLVVVNCHLMSTHLTGHERTGFGDLVHHRSAEVDREMPRAILSKIQRYSVVRAEMADAVADFAKLYRKGNLILCGDFNDTPISYTYHRIASYLTDAYRSAGNGLGRSFNQYSMFVRIDHMFCSAQWEPMDCYVDNEVKLSDHYPIVGYFQRKKLN